MTRITIPGGKPVRIRIPEKPLQPVKNIERIGYSIEETAESLGVSVPMIMPLVKEGKIRTVRVGRRIIISIKSLRDFVDGKPAVADEESIACVAEERRRT